MELIAALLFAFPLGFWLGPKRGLIAYLVLWAVVFPIQTLNVRGDDGLDWSYWPVNAVILVVGVALNRWGARRHSNRAAVTPTPEGP